MEGKSLIMSALLLSLVLGQIQGEAEVCCPNHDRTNAYKICRLAQAPKEYCAKFNGCVLSDWPCPPGWKKDILENTGVNEFCKLGCSSSVCGAMITLQESGGSEVVSGAAEKCIKACSAICTKAPIAVETA